MFWSIIATGLFSQSGSQIIRTYASKSREKLTHEINSQQILYTIIADEVTDPHGNQEILLLCLRFVDLTSDKLVIRKCFIHFIYLERTTAETIFNQIIESLMHSSISLDPNKKCGQDCDVAEVMASEKAGIQANISKVSSMAMFTHCYSHCFNL